MNRSTKVSFDSSRSMRGGEESEMRSPSPDRLDVGLVSKVKGYCAVHSNDKHEKKHGHGHGHEHHGGCSHGHEDHGHGHDHSHDNHHHSHHFF